MPLHPASSSTVRSRSRLKTDETFRRALELDRQGALEKAAALYVEVAEARPDHFEALFQLASLRYRQRRVAEARDALRAAVIIRPGEAAAWSNLAAVCNVLSRAEEALACSDRALTLRSDFPEALQARGDAFRGLMRPREAIECYDKALALRPGSVQALNNRAIALRDLGRFEEALESCNKAIAIAPSLAALHNSRAVMLVHLDRLAEALASCDTALALSPDYVEALGNRGNAMKALKRYEEALLCYDCGLALEPESAEILNNRGLTLAELRRPEEGLQSIARAIALKPHFADAHANRAATLSELGRFDEASAAIRQAIAINPRRAVLYNMATDCCRLAPGDPLIGAMEELARDMDSLEAREQVFLHFALAAAHTGSDGARSMKHLLAGNALKRKQIAYNEAAAVAAMERTRDVFTHGLIKSKAGLGVPSRAPVFIVGMPRSGSTLIEQILASHPQVFGAGETHHFPRVLAEFRGHGEGGLRFPEAAPVLSGEDLRKIGAAYVERLTRFAPSAQRIADKMLDNFRVAGLIHIALPNARIIHARRDPLDTCFSCFSKLFADGLPYTYDLGELGRHYRAYEALMDHWRQVLPENVMLEVQYEDLVGDLEGQARRIVAHCGLEWDARCLTFHKTTRQVKTASKTQVRQPLFKSSIGRARAFETDLKPLLEALQLSAPRRAGVHDHN